MIHKIDKKIIDLIEECDQAHHRSMFYILGKNFHNKVVILYHLLRKQKQSSKVSILWCHSKGLGFSIYQQKRLRNLKKKYSSGNGELTEEDLFDHFIISSDIRFCNYKDTETILGETFNMLIIQDFESLTPNILARIIETVEGGGMIIILIPIIKTLEDLYFLEMDAHARYITEAFPKVSPLFNKRFVLSLASCKKCLVFDHHFKVMINLESSLNFKYLQNTLEHSQSFKKDKLKKLQEEHSSNKFNKILELCCTVDQATTFLKLVNILSTDNLNTVVALTSARGRGKSSSLGFAIAMALVKKYSTIYVTSPYLQNTKTLFNFLLKGLKMLNYQEDKDFCIKLSNEFQNIKYISAVEVYKDRHQIVKYVSPLEFHKIVHADLLVIDEAAAIPLPVLRKWLHVNRIFMSSTINGYEGTGRSLSLKLINQLRNQNNFVNLKDNENGTKKSYILHEITLQEPIRYHNEDSVESWLNHLLCLEAKIPLHLTDSFPDPALCNLYYVNKKILFSYNEVAETFLQHIISLFVSSHYKNSPNDLLLIADAPAHHIFCLLPPLNLNLKVMPQIICAIQISFEGKLKQASIFHQNSDVKRSSGDLIPWILAQQFHDDAFLQYFGARIVRIATHPDYQSRGYGCHAIHLLNKYFEHHFLKSPTKNPSSSYDNMINYENNNNLSPPLLLRLEETPPEKLEYLGVSYGLNSELLRFWKKCNFVPVYLRQTPNDITGEYSCVMIKIFNNDSRKLKNILPEIYLDFLERFINLLSSSFKSLPTALALDIIENKSIKISNFKSFSKEQLAWFFNERSLKRLNIYCRHLVDYHLIMDLLHTISKFYFLRYLKDVTLSHTESMVLLSMGLQNKNVEEVSSEIKLETTKILGILLRIVNKILQKLKHL